MADLDNPFGQNFSIQDTMEMGMGSQELLSGLFGEESATTNPDDITEIVKEVEDPTPPAATKKTAAIPLPPQENKLQSEEPAQNLLANFLDDSEETPPENSTATETTTEEVEEKPVSTFTSLAKDLFKLGVFNTEEGEEEVEITTPEAFLERFNEEKKKGANDIFENFVGQFGEDYQNAFQAIFVKGVDPKEYFGTYNNIVSFAELDLTSELNQEAVVKQALTDQGYDPEDITTEIDRLKNYGDLESVATKHHKVLVKREAVKLHELEQKAEQELETKNALKDQYIKNVDTVLQEKLKAKEFDGIPLNIKLANELHDFLLVDKYKTRTGETLTDFDRAILELKRPENHAKKVKIALLLKILEKDPTLATIQRSGVTKKSEELFANTARQVSKDTTPINKRSNSWFKE